MSERNEPLEIDAQNTDAEQQHRRGKKLIWLIIAALLIYFTVSEPQKAGLIALIIFGLGLVIFIHELGHFLACKLVGIKVEAFSIGFPPYLLSLQKRKGKLCRAFLSDLPPEEPEQIPSAGGDENGTEYKIGAVPFGGFVKPLGQRDAGVEEMTDDPRAFNNKPLWAKVTVLVAGVTFNAISAVVIFMLVFLIGMKMPPAVVGGVVPNSPAEAAGLKAGDEIVQVNGEKNADFTTLQLAAALSGKGEETEMLIRRPDGSEKTIHMVSEKTRLMDFKSFGIEQAVTNTVPELKNPEDKKYLLETTGLAPGDEIVAVNGDSVKYGWEMEEAIAGTVYPNVRLTARRENSGETITAELPVDMIDATRDFYGNIELCHIFSMVPRLKIVAAAQEPGKYTLIARIKKWYRDLTRQEKDTDVAQRLLPGDIIIRAGEQPLPTMTQLRAVTIEYKDRELPITVLRQGENQEQAEVTVSVIPRQTGSHPDEVYIGIALSLMWREPIVAQTVDIKNGPKALEIPSGARIIAVDGIEVENFYDIMRIIRQNRGQRLSVDYRVDDENAGAVTIEIPATHDYIAARSELDVSVPLQPLTKVYKASNPAVAAWMGFKKAVNQLTQTYLTIKRVVFGDVNPRQLMGPVGILKASYDIAKESFMYYLYFMGFISAAIAGFNLLPLPILDGGVIVLSVIEEIKGSPLSLKVQAAINYVGLALILTLALLITFNDILRWIFGP